MIAALVALALTVDAADAGSAIEDFSSPAETTAPLGTKLTGEAKVLLGLDPQLYARSTDPFPPNVFDLRGKMRLAVDLKLSEHTRLFLEGRVFWRGVAEAGFARSKATFEPTLGEAFVDWYSPLADVRVGNQIVALGAGPFAPADQLSPRDLRWSFLQADAEEQRLPVFALRAQGERDRFFWQAVVVPFFVSNVYSVVGQNEALLQPGLGASPPLTIAPSVEDRLGPAALETQRPTWGDVALRGRVEWAGFRLGASWVWMNEKLPEVTVDPELASVLAANARGQSPDTAALLSLENRLRAGESLTTGVFRRQHLFSLEGSRVFGPLQLDADVSFSPQQSFVTDAAQPVRKAAFNWALSATQAEDSPWIYNVSYLGLAALGVHADELLLLVEPGTARGVERTAFLHVLVGTVSRRLWGDDFELGARGAFEMVQRSFVVGPRASLRRWQRFTFTAAAELYGGAPYSPLGYFRRNSALWLEAQADLF